MTASSRINSHTDLSRIDETRGKITVEVGGLLVNEKNIDQKTHAHHIVTGQNAPQVIPELLPGHIPAHRDPTQPQNMIRQMSRDTTLPILESNYKRVSNDHTTLING